MRKENIHEMLDKKILESFSTGISISVIQSDLLTKINNFTSVFKKDQSIDLDVLMNTNYEELSPIRTKYGITCLKHCQKRIADLDWLIKNKSKFRLLSNSQIFKLIQLRDKLSKENALPF